MCARVGAGAAVEAGVHVIVLVAAAAAVSAAAAVIDNVRRNCC